MNLKWIYKSDDVNWDELSHLYQIAPLGNKKANDLKTVFSNSMYKCFVYFDEILIRVGRVLANCMNCSYICDVSIYPRYQGGVQGKDIVKS